MNRIGIGAQVKLYAGKTLVDFQEIGTGYGYASGQHYSVGVRRRASKCFSG